MILIADTNRVMAALIKDSVSRKIIFSDKFLLLTVELTKKEIEEHRSEILEKAHITETELDALISILFSHIYVVEDRIIVSRFEEAKRIMDRIDPNDTAYIALSLVVENDGVWSDDGDFQKQKAVKVWKTSDLVQQL